MPWDYWNTNSVPQEQPEAPGMAMPEGTGNFLKDLLIPEWAQRVAGGWRPTKEEYADLKRGWMRDMPNQALGFGGPMMAKVGTPAWNAGARRVTSPEYLERNMASPFLNKVPEKDLLSEISEWGDILGNRGEVPSGTIWPPIDAKMVPPGGFKVPRVAPLPPVSVPDRSDPLVRRVWKEVMDYVESDPMLQDGLDTENIYRWINQEVEKRRGSR